MNTPLTFFSKLHKQVCPDLHLHHKRFSSSPDLQPSLYEEKRKKGIASRKRFKIRNKKVFFPVKD